MSAFEQFRALLEPRLSDILPTGARAVTLEVSAWLITVRLYVHGPIAEASYDDLEAALAPLVERLPRREGEPWQIGIELVRRDRAVSLDVYGTPIWAEPGTEFASIDLQPVK